MIPHRVEECVVRDYTAIFEALRVSRCLCACNLCVCVFVDFLLEEACRVCSKTGPNTASHPGLVHGNKGVYSSMCLGGEQQEYHVEEKERTTAKSGRVVPEALAKRCSRTWE